MKPAPNHCLYVLKWETAGFLEFKPEKSPHQRVLGVPTYVHRVCIIEGSLEAKLPTIWKDGNGTARKKLGRGES